MPTRVAQGHVSLAIVLTGAAVTALPPWANNASLVGAVADSTS